MDRANNLKGFILGATGGVGRELVQELIKSDHWSEVTVLTRRKIEEWEQFSDEEKKKLKIIVQDNFDNLNDPSKWNLQGYSSVFCCLGTRQKYGKDNFIKVDCTYPVEAGKLAAHFNVPHYSLVSAGGANPNSWFFYFKTKGQAEEGLREIKLPHLSIFRPGLLVDRRNEDRTGEKLLSYIPLIQKIQVREVARAQRIEAELQHAQGLAQNVVTYSHSQIHDLKNNSVFPKNLSSE